MSERGSYRSVPVVLLNGPDFQRLPRDARFVFLALKLNFGVVGIEVWYPAELVARLSAQTGISSGGVQDALDTLQAGGWIEREANVVWVVGQLEHDPHVKLADKKHRKMVQTQIDGLPRLTIVSRFVLAHPEWFTADGSPSGAPTEALRRANEGPSKGHRSTENEREDETEKESLVPSGDGTGEGASSGDGEYPPDFEATHAIYPKRHVADNKRKAYMAWRARLRSGVTAEVLHAGVARYCAFCEAEGKIGTRFVLMEATFFGPDAHYLEPWTISTMAAPALNRGRVLLDICRRHNLFAYNGNTDEYEAKLVRAAEDPAAGPHFRAECRLFKPWGDIPGDNDHFKAIEIERRIAATPIARAS